MRYFGVPTCPYCKKRVNLIRTWSLKRQGEYQCPRCGGISNIYLSPLIYVFALLAAFAGGALYFFHKFVLDDVSLSTLVEIVIPFACFFFLSLFMVYLEKPVIKKIPRAEMERKNRRRAAADERRAPASASAGQMFMDNDEYLPQTDYRTGPLPRPAESRPAESREMSSTRVVDVPNRSGGQQRAQGSQGGVSRSAEQRRGQTVRRGAPQPAGQRAQADEAPTKVRREPQPARRQPQAAQKVVSTPISNEDFFARYDDPEYVNRRLKELQEKQGEEK